MPAWLTSVIAGGTEVDASKFEESDFRLLNNGLKLSKNIQGEQE